MVGWILLKRVTEEPPPNTGILISIHFYTAVKKAPTLTFLFSTVAQEFKNHILLWLIRQPAYVLIYLLFRNAQAGNFSRIL